MALVKRRLSGWGDLVIGSFLVLLGWVLLVLLTARPEFRVLIDVSPGQSASVSRVTEELIRGLRDREGTRVEIYTFFEHPPAASNQRERALVAIHRQIKTLTVDLLRQYAALGGDALQVKHIDIRREPGKAREAVERLGGLKKRHVVVVAVIRDQEGGGTSIRKKELVVNYDLAAIDGGPDIQVPGASQRMPRLDDFTGEQAISSAMKVLLAGGTPVAYLLHGGMLAQPGRNEYDYTNLAAAMQDSGFNVATLNLKDTSREIPDDATVLACFEPTSEFADAEAEKLLAWLKRGGRLFLNVSHRSPESQNRKFENLLRPLGVKIGPEMVAEFRDYVSVEKARILDIVDPNPAHWITEHLAREKLTVRLVNARPILGLATPTKGVNLGATLLKTVPRCWLAGRDPRSPTEVNLIAPRLPKESFRVGTIIDVAAEIGDDRGRVVLISGAGFRNHLIGSGAQQAFALNCFEWLADREDVVHVPRDPLEVKTINLGSTQEEVSRRVFRSAIFLVVVVPLCFLGLGLIVWWRRRRI